MRDEIDFISVTSHPGLPGALIGTGHDALQPGESLRAGERHRPHLGRAPGRQPARALAGKRRRLDNRRGALVFLTERNMFLKL